VCRSSSLPPLFLLLSLAAHVLFTIDTPSFSSFDAVILSLSYCLLTLVASSPFIIFSIFFFERHISDIFLHYFRFQSGFHFIIALAFSDIFFFSFSDFLHPSSFHISLRINDAISE